MTDKNCFEQKVVSLKGTNCRKTENLLPRFPLFRKQGFGYKSWTVEHWTDFHFVRRTDLQYKGLQKVSWSPVSIYPWDSAKFSFFSCLWGLLNGNPWPSFFCLSYKNALFSKKVWHVPFNGKYWDIKHQSWRDTTFCSKHFLSILEFITKVLLTVWQSVHPYECYKRISGFV